jgi:hypothetical protein
VLATRFDELLPATLWAARVYEATYDVYQVEKALGHANVSVTETYRGSSVSNDPPLA